MIEKTFTLDDPRTAQAEAPYTFFLPDKRRIRAVTAGDHVKLIFIPTTENTKYGAERMWVQVTGVHDTEFSGILDNIPDDIPGLSLGDPVRFCDWHIIDIEFADKEKDETLRFRQRTYYERCLVDRCVLTGDAGIHFVYREQPDLDEEGDMYPDSGWRIRGDWRGQSDDEVDARECAYVALGAVLNKDDSWLHLIDMPTGAAFIKDWEKNEFVPDN